MSSTITSSPFQIAGGLSLAAAKPLTTKELPQSHTPATDDDDGPSSSTTNHQIETIDDSLLSGDINSKDSKSKESDHIKVICRFRPPNSKEMAEEKRQNMDNRGQSITVYDESRGLEVPRKTKGKPAIKFTLDRVVWYNQSQEEAFNEVAKPTVNDVIAGYEVTV